MNFSFIKGSQAEKDRIAQLYRGLGLNMQTSMQGAEVGIYQLWQLLESNKLKIFTSLSGFLSEYRIGDEQSPLLLCCHSLILGRERMRTRRELGGIVLGQAITIEISHAIKLIRVGDDGGD